MARNYIPLVFANGTHTPCALQGYPSVSFINAAGEPTGPNVTRWAGRPPLITLGPGRSATATVVQMDVNVYAGCGYPAQTSSTTMLRISLPGDGSAIAIRYPTNVCTSSTIAQSIVTAIGLPAP